jgi:hypothetical protein
MGKLEERYKEERQSPAYQAYVRQEIRSSVLVEVAADSVAWFDLGLPYRRQLAGGKT